MNDKEQLEKREISYEIKDFVGVFNNLYTKTYCDQVIEFFDKYQEAGFTKNRQDFEGVKKTFKDDSFIFMSESRYLDSLLTEEFFKKFWEVAYPLYAKHYAPIVESGHHSIYENKIQKTLPGQGYHTWHYESTDRNHCHRLLTYSVYLNDVEYGGETEFLYLGRRIKPTVGTLVIWPAAFTHTHRGNPPLNSTKYIMTGWVEF